jgi:hypothetical protein
LIWIHIYIVHICIYIQHIYIHIYRIYVYIYAIYILHIYTHIQIKIAFMKHLTADWTLQTPSFRPDSFTVPFGIQKYKD